jgi:hypothetical protein
MAEDLACVNVMSAKVNGETVVQRCRGKLVPTDDGVGFKCSDEGEEMRFEAEVIESYQESPLWHKTSAVSHMLALLTDLNPQARNSSYPWIELPLGLTDGARIETSSGSWTVNLYRDEVPYQSWPTDIPTSSEDTEAVAHSIARILKERTPPG